MEVLQKEVSCHSAPQMDGLLMPAELLQDLNADNSPHDPQGVLNLPADVVSPLRNHPDPQNQDGQHTRHAQDVVAHDKGPKGRYDCHCDLSLHDSKRR